jgi:hypothetical protein
MNKKSLYHPRQPKCYSIEELEDINIAEHLHVADNIILTNSTVSIFTCSSKNYLRRLFNQDKNTNVFYEGADRTHPLVKISTSFGEQYVRLGMLRSSLDHQDTWNFMTFDPTGTLSGRLSSLGATLGTNIVGAVHGQEGSEKPISKIITYNVNNQLPEMNEAQRPQTRQETDALRHLTVQQREEDENQIREIWEHRQVERGQEQEQELDGEGIWFNAAGESNVVTERHDYLEAERDLPLIDKTTIVYSELSQADKLLFSTIDSLPSATYVHCRNCNLERIPKMNNVVILRCGKNRLTRLPRLPRVENLWCDHNQLTSLPSLPEIDILGCEHNQLTLLPNLLTVTQLYCDHNNLTVLPPLPLVEILNCTNNNLTTLPSIPNAYMLDCENNPHLRYSRAIATRFRLPFPSPGAH